MLTSRISFVFLAFFLTGLGSAQAAPLNLILQTPKVNTGIMSTTYDATTDQFTVSGPFGGGNIDETANIAGGTYSLDAVIAAGGILSSGSLTIGGTTTLYTSGTLLTGDITQVGFGLDEVLEFLFIPTGGDLFAEYAGRLGGVILSASGYNLDAFNSSFTDSTGINSFASTAPVPIPAALWLFGSGLLGLIGFVKRVRI